MSVSGRSSLQPAKTNLLLRSAQDGLPGTFLLLTLAGQLALCLTLRSDGPVAISDDDYARVVIAQRFAASPTPDPSGTSWLPLPFFVSGGVMLALGATLDVARQTSIALALAAGALLHASGRLLGLRPAMASLGALAAAALPTATPLSIATVPEYPTAALVTFAIVGAARTDPPPPKPRDWLTWPPLLAAMAAALATASRYEAWPVALGISLVLLRRALTGPRLSQGSPQNAPLRLPQLLAAAVSSAFIGLWLLHGVFRKGDMLFFVKRVTNYKHALGLSDPDSLGSILSGYPKLLLLQEPLPLALLALGLLGSVLGGVGDSSPRPDRSSTPLSRRTLFFLPGLLLFALILGDLRGGAPTHHPERALLGVWFLALLVGLGQLSSAARGRSVRTLVVAGAAASLLLLFAQRMALPQDGFADRQEEEALGVLLAEVAPRDLVVLSTPDYGYLAIQAAAGRPDRFFVTDLHDPRTASTTTPLATRTQALLDRTEASWAIAPTGSILPGFSPVRSETRLTLYRTDSSGSAPGGEGP